MSALGRALRKKFPKGPASALRALGLDPSLLAADQSLHTEDSYMPRLTSRRALVARGAILAYLGPKLAADSKFDPASALQGVNAANYCSRIPHIVARVKAATTGELAMDADEEDLKALLQSLGREDDDSNDEINPANNTTAQQLLSRDALRRKLLSDKARRAFDEMSDADVQALIAAYLDGGDVGGEHAIDQGPDQPPDFPGKPQRGGSQVPVAADQKSFSRMYPGLPPARVLPDDNPTRRPARVDSASAASFDRMFPAAARIRSLP